MCGWRVIIQVQRMDYEQLYAILPKSHWLWTVQDTREWLNYIGLHSLQAKFEQSSVDGSILDCLSENDLIDQLGISSKIIVKKLMNWIRNGLPAFDKYVEQRGLQLQERSKLETNKMSVLQRQWTNFKEQPIKEQRIKPREPSLTEQPKRAQANELIIRNVEQNQTSNYYLKEKGGSIGRQASNEIVIMDQFVSRHHAEIIYERERYYIRDCASSSGTFIKIIQKMELKSGMIIEMGSNQFQISIDAFNNLSVLVIDGPNLEFYKEFKDLETYSFGRKQSNFVSFPDDQHLSGIHSKIFKLKGKWYIEDIATTNGTWFRLSPEGVQSEPFLLQDKSQFKLSSNLIYECILNTNNRRTHKSAEEKCCYCRLQEKNAMIIPCKHAIGCYECLLRQKECPMCETPITDIVKIFTA